MLALENIIPEVDHSLLEPPFETSLMLDVGRKKGNKIELENGCS